MASASLIVEHPDKLGVLLSPARYKGAYGGRGGAKSHFFAEMGAVRCYSDKTRIVCIREVQNSLKESVRQLLIDKIQKLGLGWFFDVTEGEIRAQNGSLIIFRGMQSYNAENIKSLEGFDIAWVEEAQTLSANSLKLLRPTLRADGSEIWFSWNPRHDTDAVDVFFRGSQSHPDSVVVNVNWRDNPWFPEILKAEMEHDYRVDPEMAGHVWGGEYQIVTEGSYYARLLLAAEKEGRIGEFSYNPDLPVLTAWDLGVDDYTAVWFLQTNGVLVWAIDYYEASGEGAEQVVAACLPEMNPDVGAGLSRMSEIERPVAYIYSRHYLPHDVRVREWGGGAKTRAETLVGLGLRQSSLSIGVAQNPVERINAVRRILPILHFANNSRVAVGLRRLRRYRRRWNDSMQTYTTPLHDENSHGADALGEFAVNCGIWPLAPDIAPKPKIRLGQVYLPGPPKPASKTRIAI